MRALPCGAFWTVMMAVAAAQSFDVVSIRRNTNGGTAGNVRPQPGGRVVMTNAPMVRLIRAAYPLPSGQLIGAPAWVDTERYDVDARARGPASATEIETMLRALLADRMKLVARVEPREQDVYALVPARVDGRAGPGLRPATLDCAEFVERRPGSGVSLPLRSNGAPPCGLSSDGRTMAAGGITIAQLIRTIAPFTGRVVIDRTGLAGYYEFTLEFAAPSGNTVGVASAADDRPSIFTALPEQLGLRLQAQRAPVDVLVIERIERPTPN
jgi:uncharacterized protein (TIGR03435 family)